MDGLGVERSPDRDTQDLVARFFVVGTANVEVNEVHVVDDRVAHLLRRNVVVRLSGAQLQ